MSVPNTLSIGILTLLLFVPAAVAQDDQYKKGYVPTDTEIAYIKKTQAYVENRLRNPSGLRFRNMYVNRKKSLGIPVVCGQVGAKATSKGDDSWQRFAAATMGDHLSLENWMSSWDFRKVWMRICQ